jgi:hypothetical protein
MGNRMVLDLQDNGHGKERSLLYLALLACPQGCDASDASHDGGTDGLLEPAAGGSF